jgi:glycosyltransferase involved in cell wall biosynthesis
LEENLSFEARKDFCFIGNFLHKPNWDAVLQLKQHIWPLLRKAVPDASLRIYGAYASQKVTDLHQPKERFLVCGRAENALETLASHRVLLAPIRFGAGIKGKFLDAMQAGTPSVTTTVGAEGMTPNGIWSGFIADNPMEFVEHSIALYHQQDTWIQAQKIGTEILQQHFDFQSFKRPFVEHFSHLIQNIGSHRESNFIGQMLQHHQYQSTKYMSLWIEEKEKNAAAASED